MCPASSAARPASVEDLGDETHVAHGGRALPVGDGDPGRLLATVLEGVEAEVRALGELPLELARVEPEDAARLFRLAVILETPLKSSPPISDPVKLGDRLSFLTLPVFSVEAGSKSSTCASSSATGRCSTPRGTTICLLRSRLRTVTAPFNSPTILGFHRSSKSASFSSMFTLSTLNVTSALRAPSKRSRSYASLRLRQALCR